MSMTRWLIFLLTLVATVSLRLRLVSGRTRVGVLALTLALEEPLVMQRLQYNL